MNQEVQSGSRHAESGVESGEAVRHRVHRDEQVAFEAEPGKVVVNGLGDEVEKRLAKGGPDVTLRGLNRGQRFCQPAGSQVVAKLADLQVQRLRRAPVSLGEELDALPPHVGRIGAEAAGTGDLSSEGSSADRAEAARA